MLSWLGFAGGVLLLWMAVTSAVKTFLIPRGTSARLNNVVAKFNYRVFWLLTRWVEDQGRREQIYAAQAPVFLMILLASWLVSLYAGFTLLFRPFALGYAAALRDAGSSLFTLGFAAPAGAAENALVVLAAASGLSVLALLISYLPVLYAAFNRREILVAMFEALAGAPPWGPELLARQALVDNVAAMPDLYDQWTVLAADISESHVNYRSLVYFRTPDPNTSWLLSMLAVLDGAALHLALNPASAPFQARALLRVGYIALRRLAHGNGLPVNDDPGPDDPLGLTRAEFDEAVRWVTEAGWSPERSADDAWPHFRAWRVNYESSAYQLAARLDLPPALWSGPRRPGRPAAKPPRRPSDRKPGQKGGPAHARASVTGPRSGPPART